MSTLHYMRPPINWHGSNAPYLCGAMDGSATSKTGPVTCADCLNLLAGGSEPRPLHRPPMMNDDESGTFTFYDVDNLHPDSLFRQEWPLEVTPQTTGNVEVNICGTLFTLHHLDRADLIRALLHDFHYSPERFGPTDDD